MDCIPTSNITFFASLSCLLFDYVSVLDKFPYPSYPKTVADPMGGPEARAPPAPVKTGQKKMAATVDRKFRESLGPLGQISGSATVRVMSGMSDMK